MTIKPIRTEADYLSAIKELDSIFDAKKSTKQWDKLEILSILIENYEKKHHHIEAPDPIEAIKFRMEQLGLEAKDLEKVLWYKSRVSEILHRKRKLSLQMIRNLSKELKISPSILIKSY